MHTVPDYLKKAMTLRLMCRKCKSERLHRCRAVGVRCGVHQEVESICLTCERTVTK